MPGPSDSFKLTDNLAVSLKCIFCGREADKDHHCALSLLEEIRGNEEEIAEITAVGHDQDEGVD